MFLGLVVDTGAIWLPRGLTTTRAVRRTLNLSDLVGPAVEICSAQCARIAALMICHGRVTHTIHHKQLGLGV